MKVGNAPGARLSINQIGSVLTIFTFKVQHRRGFQISLDYSHIIWAYVFN